MESKSNAYPNTVIFVRRVPAGSGGLAPGTTPSTLPTSDTQNRQSRHIKVANPVVRVMGLPEIRNQYLPNNFFNEQGKERAQPPPISPRTSPIYDLPPPIPRRPNQEGVSDAPEKTLSRKSTDYVSLNSSPRVSKQRGVEGVPKHTPVIKEKPASSKNYHEPPARPAGLYRTKGNIPSYSTHETNFLLYPSFAPRYQTDVPQPPSNEGVVTSLPNNKSLKQEPEPSETHLRDVQSPARNSQPSAQDAVCDIPPSPRHIQEGPYTIPPRHAQTWTQEGVYDAPPKRPARHQPPRSDTVIKQPDEPTIAICNAPPTAGISPPWSKEGVYDVPPKPKVFQPFTEEGVYDVPPRRPARQSLPPPRLKTSMFEKTEQTAPDVLSRVSLGHIRDNTSLYSPRTSTDVLGSFIHSSNITELNQKTFKDFISARESAVVMFYTPSEKKFQQFKDQYVEASKTTFHHNHAFASVDCSREEDLCRNEHITSLPAFKLYNNGITMKTIQGSVLKAIQGSAIISAAKIQEYIDKYSYSQI